MTDLSKYKDMKICVAVSGGRDSMALLHYLHTYGKSFGIELSALNCDHKIRGEQSASDSAFVKKWCEERGIALYFFEWNTDGKRTETAARNWRRECYKKVLSLGFDAVATAHHLDDNAETVLFNLARGSALSGLRGITEGSGIIRPFIECTRADIDNYISENKIPYVDDDTNFTDDYTRNRIRHNVLPELERAVPAAARSIFRFSRLAAEDESYFENLIERLNLINDTPYGVEISFCEEKAVFRRAAVKVIKQLFGRKDYTQAHADILYNLQFSESGKAFEFLGLTAYKENGKIAITESGLQSFPPAAFDGYSEQSFHGEPFILSDKPEGEGKVLKFDRDKIPASAVIRFMQEGDIFKKFKGGTKKLGDYFTDKKIPVRIRRKIPMIADGNEILAVGGVEISDGVKITPDTKHICYLICTDYTR